MTPIVRTTIFSPPECNLPVEPERLGPSNGVAEKNEDGTETGRVIVPGRWFIDVFIVNDQERQWRQAAKPCLEARK